MASPLFQKTLPPRPRSHAAETVVVHCVFAQKKKTKTETVTATKRGQLPEIWA